MKLKTFVLMLVGLLVLSTFTIFLPVEVSSATDNTFYVDNYGQGDYTSIQDAINASSDGDTIYVYGGIYSENIVINKSITLRGENNNIATVSDNAESNYFVTITADHVIVQELKFRISDARTYGGIFNIQSNNVTIQRNNIDNSIEKNNTFHGITSQGFTGHTIDNNKITSHMGITLYSCSDATVSNNILIDPVSENPDYSLAREGIRVQDSFNIIISNNVIKNFHYAIWALDTIGINIESNTIELGSNFKGSGYGIYMYHSSNGNIIGNTVKEVTTTYPYQNFFIKLYSSSNNIISGNLIQNIPDHGKGLYIHYESDNNQIYENMFTGGPDGYSRVSDVCLNYWYNPETLMGNYWDNYQGTDADGDGIGDTPYNISGGNNQDKFPLGYFINIEEQNIPPIAEAGEHQIGKVNISIIFNGSGSMDTDGNINNYIWDFGDGHTGTGISSSHTYTTAGNYTVSLTVTDNDGAIDTDTAVVSVSGDITPDESTDIPGFEVLILIVAIGVLYIFLRRR